MKETLTFYRSLIYLTNIKKSGERDVPLTFTIWSIIEFSIDYVDIQSYAITIQYVASFSLILSHMKQ